MFQTFEATTSPDQGPPRLKALRERLKADGLDGLLVPRADAHQGEYVAHGDERLAWLTGFTGSAGFAAVLMDKAAVFIDGRYRTQVKHQVDVAHFTPVNWPDTKLGDWLVAEAQGAAKIGFDMWLHTSFEIEQLNTALADCEAMLWPVDSNPLDAIWEDRPAAPNAKITAYPADFAGETHESKLDRIAADLADAGEASAVLTLPDSIAWLLNIRGADIPHNPTPQVFAILHADGRCDLYAAPGATDEITDHLGRRVTVHDKAGFAAAITRLKGRVRVDPKTAPFAIPALLEDHATLSEGPDPCILPKARKNETEIAATREAHLRDGAAMVEFLAWLDKAAPNGGLTEIDVVKKLEGFRRATNALHDISFDTICGAGPNGAIIHYRVTEGTNRDITPGELLLIDSGGQYVDGTTDITRTVSVGPVPDAARGPFTRVLQGMIAISRVRWPRGLAGRDLDPLARAPLWMAGQDYDHGTGHGVGVFLNVHEGPQRIARISEIPLEPGMILSNEPGYYREGAFGIRIENLVVVTAAPKLHGGDDRDQLSFETLTFVPIDTRIINHDLLSPGEREWLNAYHAESYEKLKARVSDTAKDWLKAATRAI